MRIVLYGLFIILLPAISGAWYAVKYDTVTTIWPNGNLKEYFTRAWFTTNEKGLRPHGLYNSWYENGQLKEQGYYDWDKKIGVWIEWYDTGVRKKEAVYNAGKLHGLYYERYPNNILKIVGQYKDGKKNGFWVWRKPYDDPNNPCIIHERLFYDDKLLVTIIDSTKWVFEYGIKEFYNRELNTWIEWTHARDFFHIGKKTDANKDGKWIRINRLGEIIKTEKYNAGELLYSDME